MPGPKPHARHKARGLKSRVLGRCDRIGPRANVCGGLQITQIGLRQRQQIHGRKTVWLSIQHLCGKADRLLWLVGNQRGFGPVLQTAERGLRMRGRGKSQCHHQKWPECV